MCESRDCSIPEGKMPYTSPSTTRKYQFRAFLTCLASASHLPRQEGTARGRQILRLGVTFTSFPTL